MATDYKIEFRDVNNTFWRVWIKDTYVNPGAYNFIAKQLSRGFNPGTNEFLVENWFWYDPLPGDVTSIILNANGYNREVLPPFGVEQYFSFMTSNPIYINGGAGVYSLTLKRAGAPDEVVHYRDGLADNNTDVIDLKAAGSCPMRIKTVNNEDDKIAAIRAKEVEILFLNEDGSVNINTFSGEGPDDRWRVDIHCQLTGASSSQTVFSGFLQLDSLSEPLAAPANIVRLTATDKLGSLKDVTFKDFNGKNLFGIYPLIKVIAMALASTGLEIDIQVFSSAKIVTSEGDRLLLDAYIDAKAFLGKSAYDVVDKLLAGKYYIVQEFAKWQIIDVDDMDGSNVPVTNYTHEGNFINTEIKISNIDMDMFINDPAIVELNRPVKYAQTSYKIDIGYLLYNQDYQLGNANNKSPWNYFAMQETGLLNDTIRLFDLDGWELNKADLQTGELSAPNARAMIMRYYLYGSEVSRQIMIQREPTETGWLNYILENRSRIPVRVGDRVSVAMEVRFAGYVTPVSTSLSCAQLLLFAKSGKVYAQTEETGVQAGWADVTNAYNKQHFFKVKDILGWPNIFPGYGTTVEEFGTKSWASFSNAKEFLPPMIPEDGIIKLRLCLFSSEFSRQNFAPGQPNTNPSPVLFRNIRIDIKSSFGFVTGMAHGWRYVAERRMLYNSKIETETLIDNTPYLYFSGCLLQKDSNPGNLYGYKEIVAVKNKAKTFNSYGEMVTSGLWNQYNRVFRTVKGSHPANVFPNMNCIYKIDGLDNKIFALLSFSWDVKNKIVHDAIYKEVYDTSTGKEDKFITREVEEKKS